MSHATRAEAKSRSIRLAALFGAGIFVVAVVVFALLGLWLIGVVIGLVAAVAGAWLAFIRSTRLVLDTIGVTAIEPADQPRLASLVDGLSIVSGVHRPRLFLLDTAAPNAVVVGHDLDSASLIVTTGLIVRLNRVELEGVLAHAMSRLDTGEAQVTTVAAGTIGLPIMLAERWRRAEGPSRVLGLAMTPLALAVAPLVGKVIEHDLETRADLAGIGLTRFPPGLAAALEELSGTDPSIRSSPTPVAALHLLPPYPSPEACPLPGVARHLPAHRPVSERVELLREL